MASKTFEQILKAFVTATNNSKKHALTLSHMAIETFHEHGDLSRAQLFLDAMPQNYLRKQAFVAWMVEFSPAKVEGTKFVKDQSRDESTAWNIEKALETSFWDFSPEKPIVNFSLEDAKTQVLRLVKRFENSEKYKAEDDAAVNFVQSLSNFANTYTPNAADNDGGTDEIEDEDDAGGDLDDAVPAAA